MLKNLARVPYVCAVLLFSHLASAEVYKTIDNQGRVVYTDRPPAKAKAVELPNINTLPQDKFIPNVGPAFNAVVDADTYQVDVITPASGYVLQVNERNLNVSVNLDKALQPGHVLAYFWDGYILQKTAAMAITIVEPTRGEHKLHVDVMSKYGKHLGQSDAVSVVVSGPNVPKESDKVPKK
ncbi:MAG: DUF4124 domain-containing protein [Pseudomonadota bacterium]